MNLKKLYTFLIGSLLSILLLFTDSAYLSMEESSTTKASIMEVSPDKDKDFKFLTTEFKLTQDETTRNTHLYFNVFSSSSYRRKLFRPPTLI